MQWHGFKIPIVLLALALGLVVLLGAQWAYNKYSFEQPLEQSLAEEDVIKDFSVNDNGEELIITVELDSPSNLLEEYRNIENVIKGIVNERAFRVELVDNRNDALEEAYYKSQFSIYEAIERGNFRQMDADVQEAVEVIGGNAKVFIGPRNIFLHMSDGDHYLYEVISRENAGLNALVTGGGENYHD